VSNVLELEAEKSGISCLLPKSEGYKLVSQIKSFFAALEISNSQLQSGADRAQA
jgi:hypothetical protein